MKDKICFIRDIEEQCYEASASNDLKYHGALMACLSIIQAVENYGYCENCHKLHEAKYMRGDYCEACEIAGHHQMPGFD